jgi:mannose-6-phosphate isomerase class I
MYTPNPCYPPAQGRVDRGWDSMAASVHPNVSVIAVDGPAISAWESLIPGLSQAFDKRGKRAEFVPTATWFLPWAQVQRATSSFQLRDDPDFDFLASGDLRDLLRPPAHLQVPEDGVLVVYGPGAALAPHDVLWYADLPKRYAEAAVSRGHSLNLGQRPGPEPPTTKRLFFVDWPLLDRHRDQLVGRVDYWLDVQDPTCPAFLSGDALRSTLAALSTRPFRTRPTFNTTPWGGHWGQARLGHNPGALNTALGYELIAPEAGVLVGADDGPQVELPFQLVVAAHPVQVLGEAVQPVFGTSFPIRFDYLDTYGGGNLSVHCHPRADYMKAVFGWPYTQHESYYVMIGSAGRQVFLGLQDNVDVEAFRRQATDADGAGTPFEIERYVTTFPASEHQLFLIPAGTPHGSGEGNVILEISATPYLYSLRFYDWLRRNAQGSLRPVHIAHAFANLNTERSGNALEGNLVQKPRQVRSGDGWGEEVLGALPEMFFDVRRLSLAPGAVAEDDTIDRFHILNVVEGDGIVVQPQVGLAHALAYAETMVVPAAVGPYRLEPLGMNRVRVVKATVRRA